jgi:hypothetical protein
MLKKKLLVVALLSSCAYNANATDIQSALANICNIVVADDKSELRKKMKIVRSNFKMKLSDYYEGISCNGNSLIRTAVLNNAVEAGTLLVKKMPKKHLSSPEKDGKTLQAWIEEQGKADNPIAATLAERI